MIAFDLEVLTWPEEGDWDGQTKLGITCAAVAYRLNEEIVTKVWQGKTLAMSPEEVGAMLDELALLDITNGPVYTWNGGGFDFKAMAVECPKRAIDIARMAFEHVDGMLLVTAEYGHWLGLDKTAVGMGIEGKLKEVMLSDGTVITEMSGKMAPELWARGERDAVIEYLRQDVVTSLLVGEFQLAQGRTKWVSAKGRNNSRKTDFVTVGRLPNTPPSAGHWISDPKSKDEIMDWAYVTLGIDQSTRQPVTP